MDHELEILDQYIEEARLRHENRRRLREINLNIEHPGEDAFNSLDSSIKKNSAFVKKLRGFTESQRESIFAEIDRLNLTKFISEVAASIIEAKLKLSDIPAVIELCTRLNRKYPEFNQNLLQQYVKYFPALKSKIKSNVTPNPSKFRVDLRLFAELIVSGVLPPKESFPTLMNLLCYLMIHDKNNHQNANSILTFCKGCGDELMGLAPKKIAQYAQAHDRELPIGDLIPSKKQEALKNYIVDYYQSLLKYLNGIHAELVELVTKNRRIYKSKGEITKDAKEQVDSKHSECRRVHNVMCQLADLLNLDETDLPDLEGLKDDQCDESSEMDSQIESTTAINSLWDDEGTKSFYEDILDLRALFPNLTVKKPVDRKKNGPQADDKVHDEVEKHGMENDDKPPVEDGESSRDSTPTKEATDCAMKGLSSSSSEESLNVCDTSSAQPGTSPLLMSQAVANRMQPDQYFTKLSCCVNRDMIDNAAIDFIRFFNTKFGRRKLIKTLFNVQRTRLDLLPFFARLAATIYPFVPSIGNELALLLKHDFRNLFRKKDQINIESKVKNVRFIGELVKFGLYSKQEALSCLKMLLSDFTHHHIEMTCNLLETCGRLIYMSNESHHQTKLLLEQMMRKKQLLSVDSKYITMIENAYYFTNPPEIIRHVTEEPPVHIYVRYLLCESLNRATIDSVLQKIKKLDWSDKSLTKFAINCMIEAYNLKFYNIRYLAALLAALNKDYPWIPVAVIDGVVEDILLMMELNEVQYNQRRIPMIRYFGELYNYRLSDSSLVFKILYSLITYGVYYPQPGQNLAQIPMSQLDLPNNLFRIKLVCDLLDTCGQFLNSGQEKKKLDCYLLVFQRYYWCKKHIYMLHPYCSAKSGNQFPAATEYMFNDTIYNLRPTFQMATSYSEANERVKNFIDNLITNQPQLST